MGEGNSLQDRSGTSANSSQFLLLCQREVPFVRFS